MDLQKPQTERESRFDKIKKHLKNPERHPLSDKLQEQLNRWDFIVDLVKSYNTEPEIRDKLMHKYQMSRAQAYRDIQDAKQFYGSTTKEEKNFWRQVAIQWQVEIIRKSMEEKNWKQANAGIKNLATIMGLDKDDIEMPNWEELTNNNYVLVVNADNRQYTLNLTDAENIPEEQKQNIIASLPKEIDKLQQQLDGE